ncbi:MAG: MoaD/ThiS family protein [Planctomycetes bacterium]|nr:MoaD/ThiS family protein [Planctomycetota bacterium]
MTKPECRKVILEIPHALSRLSDDVTDVPLEGSTVGEVLDALWERFPKLKSRVLDRNGHVHPYLLLMHNDEMLPRADVAAVPLSNGDRLEIVALAEGG